MRTFLIRILPSHRFDTTNIVPHPIELNVVVNSIKYCQLYLCYTISLCVQFQFVFYSFHWIEFVIESFCSSRKEKNYYTIVCYAFEWKQSQRWFVQIRCFYPVYAKRTIRTEGKKRGWIKAHSEWTKKWQWRKMISIHFPNICYSLCIPSCLPIQ